MRFVAALALIACLGFAGCSQGNPAAPNPITDAARSQSISSTMTAAKPPAAGQPEYEGAYYAGSTVMINAIEVKQNPGPLEHAAADLYVVTYPVDHSLWPSTPPQCNPCDHAGDGVDPGDYHDHVLDSIPSSPGHGEFNPLWHVFAIVPVPGHEASYAARLPMKSEEAVDAAIAAGDAIEIDTHFYFLCAVVDPSAAK
jgi:hypothetical protein